MFLTLANRYPSSVRYNNIPIASIDPNSHILRCGQLGLFLRKRQLKGIVPNLPKSIRPNALIGCTTAHIFHTLWTGNNEQSLDYSRDLDHLVDPIVYSITAQSFENCHDTVQADHVFAPHINRVIGQVIFIYQSCAFILIDSDVKVVPFGPFQWEDEAELRDQAHQQCAHNLSVPYDDLYNIQLIRKQVGDRYYQHPRPGNCAPWLGELNSKSNVNVMDPPIYSVVRCQQRMQSVESDETTQLSFDQLMELINSPELKWRQLSSDQSIKLTYSREFLLAFQHSAIPPDRFPVDLPTKLLKTRSCNHPDNQSKSDPCVRNSAVLRNRATNNETTKKIRDRKVAQRVMNSDDREQSEKLSADPDSFSERYKRYDSMMAKQASEGRANKRTLSLLFL